jgi:hypothetical protein
MPFERDSNNVLWQGYFIIKLSLTAGGLLMNTAVISAQVFINRHESQEDIQPWCRSFIIYRANFVDLWDRGNCTKKAKPCLFASF